MKLESTKRYTKEGLPRDDKDWTVDDWIDLHRGMERIKKRISARHKELRLRKRPMDVGGQDA